MCQKVPSLNRFDIHDVKILLVVDCRRITNCMSSVLLFVCQFWILIFTEADDQINDLMD